MAKTKKKARSAELDGIFVLKLVLYVVLGSLWLKIGKNNGDVAVPLPLGFAVGMLLTSHEHFRIDRKIEYAVLVIAALIGLIAPYGLFLNL